MELEFFFYSNFIWFLDEQVSEYSHDTPSSRESSAERPVSPPTSRKRPRPSSRSLVIRQKARRGRRGRQRQAEDRDEEADDDQDEEDDEEETEANEAETDGMQCPLVEATYGNEPGENGVRADKEDKLMDHEMDKKLAALDSVNRESLLSQALEGRSHSLMAHLLATRSSNQSDASSGHGGINSANVEDEASDSDDTEASDR